MLRAPALLLCLLLCACGGGLKSKLCGDEGLPCCTGSVCNGSTICSQSQVCEACGAPGDACCAGSQCNDGASCQSNVCVAGCVDPCSPGTSRCSGAGGIELCQSTGSCPTWATAVPLCPSGTQCLVQSSQATCEQRCLVTCTPGTAVCTAEGLKNCVQGTTDPCPLLQPATEVTDLPTCMPGLAESSSLTWESPTPAERTWVAGAGDAPSRYFLVGADGTVVSWSPGAFTVEVPAQLPRPTNIVTCGEVSWAVAVGDDGLVLSRKSGGWVTEQVGTGTLAAADCDFDQTAVAGESGAWLKRNGTWAQVDPGVVAKWSGVTLNTQRSELFLVGENGAASRCTGLGTGPLTCTPESVGTTAALTDVWADRFTGDLWVTSRDGGLYRCLGQTHFWERMNDVSQTEALLHVRGIHDDTTSMPRTYVAATGESGAVVWALGPTLTTTTLPSRTEHPVLALTPLLFLFPGLHGELWSSPFVESNATAPTEVGGARPTTSDLSAVGSVGNGRVLAVGAAGTRLRRENGAWLNDANGLSVAEDLFGLAALSDGESYAVGASGRVLHRRFGAWSVEAQGLTDQKLAAATADTDFVYAVGNDGTWLERPRTSQGAWARVDTGIHQDLVAVTVLADPQGHAQEVVAVSSGCTVLSKRAGAFTSTQATPCASLTSAVFTADGNLLVGGAEGSVLLRAGSGWAVDQQALHFAPAIAALIPGGATTWAVTEAGAVLKRTNGWNTLFDTPMDFGLHGGVVDSASTLWLVGDGGLIWRWQ
jgi:hypothetical protein